ncbi:hypothetical protein LPMP_270260 [Leishmania panamensis]|uniref:Uncharacterized protein n=1 Tax=Leishmania panamensis TaxID=5679 RepID=A0A088RTC6_LEIPA|nr:hypothetical protein LPMP_270260 [Leishmania panamensis]AIN99407.1 hypothetical protein LPMP_270260 [Leishmania panamensis]
MWRLHIPTSLSEGPTDSGVSILVGQRSYVSFANETPCTVCALAGYVQCDDPSVLEEQIECLEHVLPFGIEVLGFAGDTVTLTSLAAQMPDLKRKELIEVVVHSGEGHRRLAYRMFGASAKKVEVVEDEIAFVEVRCALHTYDSPSPLLVSCSNALPQVVDGEGYAPLMERAPAPSSKMELIQTGAVSSTLRFHVVMVPSLLSARGLYETLFRQLKAASTAGTTRLIELNAHNAHLSYCCRLKCRADALASRGAITEEEWAVVLEMIEDATGQRVSRGDVRGAKPLHHSGEKSKAPEAKTANNLPAQLPLCFLSLLVVLLAVALLSR